MQPTRVVPGEPSAQHGTKPMQEFAQLTCSPDRPAGCAPRKRDGLWTILLEVGVWPGLSVDAVIDRFETETRTTG